MVQCPVCTKWVPSSKINDHLDSDCASFVHDEPPRGPPSPLSSSNGFVAASQKRPASSFFQSSSAKRHATLGSFVKLDINGDNENTEPKPGSTSPQSNSNGSQTASQKRPAANFFQTPSAKRHATPDNFVKPAVDGNKEHSEPQPGAKRLKRSFDEGPDYEAGVSNGGGDDSRSPIPKKVRTISSHVAPLADRMRPRNLDEIIGQELVGPNSVLRCLVEANNVPSMIIWGGSGTGKTTIARCIANQVQSRFIEISATSSDTAECKRLFTEAARDLAVLGRKTIIFCDDIHRLSKTQQDIFLAPVETGAITLIGATTENPSFKILNTLLSRCRILALQRLSAEDIQLILMRALQSERPNMSLPPPPPFDAEFITYLANFADGDARVALNLLELALSLANRGEVTKEDLKASLMQSLIDDRVGEHRFDNISAFQKSVRGSDPDAALYYLVRMLQSGEDPVLIARRMIVIASEDIGLADNSMLTLATSTFTAMQQVGMPQARISLAHCAVALALAPKSTRIYRGLNKTLDALREPGVSSLPVPIHLRNPSTRQLYELGYGKEYKYNPNYKDGKVKQDYLPKDLLGRRFLEDRDLGTEIDPDLVEEEL